MITNISPSSQVFLAGVAQVQERIAQANQQISSGLKISVASDAPDSIADLLQLRAHAAQNTQMQSNLTLELTNAQTADSAIGNAIQIMDSAVQIAASGANSTATAATRATLADQVTGLLNQVVSISQTQVQGRYIFSGDDGQHPAYQVDLGASSGVDQISAAAATRQIQNPQGGTFLAAQTAEQIFASKNSDGSAAPDNVFGALNSLRIALQNNDSAGITAAQDLLKNATSHLNDSQSFYGNVENQIQSATAYATTYSTQLETQIGHLEDADVAAAAEELTAANTQLQAAFQAQANAPRSSLFNYLG